MGSTRGQDGSAGSPARETTDPPWPLTRLDENEVPPALTRLWSARWPGCDPVGHQLRDQGRDRWVRIHSLPASKRYPETEAEYVELLRRHHAVVESLIEQSSSSSELTVVVGAWPDANPAPADLEGDRQVLIPSRYWRSVCTDSDSDGWESWLDLFVTHLALDSPALDTILRRVADEALQEVIITDSGLTWLYHPYDGGGDAIAASPAHRDRLAADHRDWLSAHPHGL